MVCHMPGAILGLMKLYRGEYAGQERLSDLIRATVYVDESKPEEIFKVLNHISAHPCFRLVRLKERLVKLKDVNANFIFQNKCVCEVQVKLGKEPPFYHGNHFLYEVERMQQLFEVVETLNNKAIWLADHDLLTEE